MRFSAFLLCLWVAAPSAAVSQSDQEGLTGFSKCWNIGILNTKQLSLVIDVEFENSAVDGIDLKSIRMLRWTGGDAQNARRVYDSVRRAIALCSASVDLPSGTIVARFDPINGVQAPNDLAPLTDT